MCDNSFILYIDKNNYVILTVNQMNRFTSMYKNYLNKDIFVNLDKLKIHHKLYTYSYTDDKLVKLVLDFIENEKLIKDLITYNTRIRQEEINKSCEYNHTKSSLSKLITNDYDIDDTLQDRKLSTILSNKGIDFLKEFIYLLNGINPITHKFLQWKNSHNKYKILAYIIVWFQLFTDGNHRTSMYFLEKVDNTNIEEFSFLINKIVISGNIYLLRLENFRQEMRAEFISRELAWLYDNLPSIISMH